MCLKVVSDLIRIPVKITIHTVIQVIGVPEAETGRRGSVSVIILRFQVLTVILYLAVIYFAFEWRRFHNRFCALLCQVLLFIGTCIFLSCGLLINRTLIFHCLLLPHPAGQKSSPTAPLCPAGQKPPPRGPLCPLV